MAKKRPSAMDRPNLPTDIIWANPAFLAIIQVNSKNLLRCQGTAIRKYDGLFELGVF